MGCSSCGSKSVGVTRLAKKNKTEPKKFTIISPRVRSGLIKPSFKKK